MKKYLIILLFPVLLFSQSPVKNRSFYGDTLKSWIGNTIHIKSQSQFNFLAKMDSLSANSTGKVLIGSKVQVDSVVTMKDTVHATYLIQDSVRNLPMLCYKSERSSLVAGTWDTVAYLGSGVYGTVTRLFVGITNEYPYPFASMDSVKLRITCDGAATPQIGGTKGIPIMAFFGRPFDSNYVFWSDRITVSANTSYWYGAQWSEIYIPFSSGVLVEAYTPNDGKTKTSYSMIEYTTQKDFIIGNVNLKNYSLNTSYIPDTTISGLDTLTMLDYSGDALLFGIMHNIKYSSLFNWQKSNEGNYLIYYNGELIPSFESSGAEDMFNQSFTFHTDDSTNLYTNYTKNFGLIYLDAVAHSKQSEYRFFDYAYAPRATSRLRLKWVNGDVSVADPGSVTSESLVLYYKKQ